VLLSAPVRFSVLGVGDCGYLAVDGASTSTSSPQGSGNITRIQELGHRSMCCEMLSSGHGMVVAHMNLKQLCWGLGI